MYFFLSQKSQIQIVSKSSQCTLILTNRQTVRPSIGYGDFTKQHGLRYRNYPSQQRSNIGMKRLLCQTASPPTLLERVTWHRSNGSGHLAGPMTSKVSHILTRKEPHRPCKALNAICSVEQNSTDKPYCHFIYQQIVGHFNNYSLYPSTKHTLPRAQQCRFSVNIFYSEGFKLTESLSLRPPCCTDKPNS